MARVKRPDKGAGPGADVGATTLKRKVVASEGWGFTDSPKQVDPPVTAAAAAPPPSLLQRQ